MSTDAPQSPRPTKVKYLRWLALAASLFVAWFCWQLFGPNPPIIISKDTTYITAPLLPNGLPDYEKYVLDKYREGVTPENNAAVLLLQALGPGDLEPSEFPAVCSEIGLAPVPPAADAMEPLDEADNRQRISNWLGDFGQTDSDRDRADEVIREAVDHPWSSDTVPPLAAWIHRNERSLDLIVRASERPRYYLPSPTLLNGTTEILIAMLLPNVQSMRDAARALLVRAMWHLGENRPVDAWRDLRASHRLARLMAQGPTLVEQFVAIGTDEMQVDGTVALLDDHCLTADEARQILSDLAARSNSSSVATSLDQFERWSFLDVILLTKKDGAGGLLEIHDVKPHNLAVKLLNRVSIDWNLVLREGNQWYDRMSAAARISDGSARRKALDQFDSNIGQPAQQLRQPGQWIAGAMSRQKRSELVATSLAAWFISDNSAAIKFEDRANTHLELLRLAATLAVYRAEHGQYPDKLEDLVPTILPQLPVDLYHAKPFVYKRDAEGYLLYSTGENGIDDGGSNEQYRNGILAGRELDWNDDPTAEKLRKQIPAGADDLSIRVPRPAFKLPSPSAKR